METKIWKKKKVVFRDADRDKVAFGFVTFEEGFVKVTNDKNSSIYINKKNIVTIKDGRY